MKSIFESVIRQGEFDLSSLLHAIDSYHVEGKLSDEDRLNLYALARRHARPSVDLISKVAQLEIRIAALENPAVPETHPPYEAGCWYYAGDKISFRDKIYRCCAPQGAVCTWSPQEYPAYWEEITKEGEENNV